MEGDAHGLGERRGDDMIQGLPYDAEIAYIESTGTQWQWIEALGSAQQDADSFEMSVAMLTDNNSRRLFAGSGSGSRQYLEVTDLTMWGQIAARLRCLAE